MNPVAWLGRGFWSSLVLGAVGLLSLPLQAAVDDYECIADAPGQEICLVAPDESEAPRLTVVQGGAGAPTAKPATQTEANPAAAARRVSMVSQSELSGEALPFANLVNLSGPEPLDADQNVGRNEAGTALADALGSEDKLHWIETFLKAGPAALSPDLRVTTTNNKSK